MLEIFLKYEKPKKKLNHFSSLDYLGSEHKNFFNTNLKLICLHCLILYVFNFDRVSYT